MVNKSLEILKGELTKKEEKQSSNKKTFWSLEIAGLGKAGVWDKKIADMLHVGNTYEYSYESDGKYNTIQSVKEVAQSTPETPRAAMPPAEHGQSYIPQPKNDQAIMAQVALKSAVERANGIVGRELLTKEVIQIGQEYFRAMQAWAQGKVYTSTTEPPAPAISQQAIHVVSTHVGPSSSNDASLGKAPPEGKTGQELANDEQWKRILELGHKLTGFKGKKDDDIIRAVCTSIRAEDTKSAKALDVAGIIANWENHLKQAKAPQQGKIMDAESGEPF